MSNRTFVEAYLGVFKPDDSYGNCLKRVRSVPSSQIAEELHCAHKRNEAKDKRIAELENQWISVEDRLPETFQRVLALTADYDLDPVHTLVHFNGARAGFLSVGGKKDKKVTHWMPLPAPPKEQGE